MIEIELLHPDAGLSELRMAIEQRLSVIRKENGYQNDVTIYDFATPTYTDARQYPFVQVIPSGVNFEGRVGRDAFRLEPRFTLFYAAALKHVEDQSILLWESLTEDILRSLAARNQKYQTGGYNSTNLNIDGITAPDRDEGERIIRGTIEVSSKLTLKTINH